MSEHETALQHLRGLTLIHEDTQIRPAAMSHVKPSEYRFYAERAMQFAVEDIATARTDTLREVEAWLTLRHPLVAADFHDAFTPTPHQPGARSAPRGR